MECQIEEMAGLSVVVNDVVWLPDLETPADRPFAFAYYITIQNDSDLAVQIRGRKWVVRSIGRPTTVVEGDGVVGQFPRIEAGESFSYNSYHVVATDSIATGAFLAMRADGVPVFVRVPRFRMVVPIC